MDRLFDDDPFRLRQPERDALLTPALNELCDFHRASSAAYARLLEIMWPGFESARTPADVPFLPVGLFKSHRLASVPDDRIVTTLTSSGTTGQEVSRVYLDAETAQRQAVALAAIMRPVLGPDRLPMIIVESKSLLRSRREYGARGAGVLGMMNFGRAHFFALDDAMELDHAGLEAFLAKHGDRPFLIFGFTFMVWRYLLQQAAEHGYDLSRGILVHSGGWKKLNDEAVSSAEFKARFKAATGLSRVYNFYGMVEQVGSVFLEGEDGFLYAPAFADVIVRDPRTWHVAPPGEPGVLQVLSLLPRSYPGHSLLTEDLGIIHGVDDSTCGRGGKRFSVIGRVPKSELRGCSDTHAYSRQAAA